MNSGNNGSTPSSTTTGYGGGVGGGGGGSIFAGDVNPSAHFNPTSILQPPSNFFDQSSFSQPLNPNPNPNSINSINSIYNLDSNPIHDLDYRDPYPIDDNNINHEKFGVTTKNPKKRTRASRRAPTTVLTTDTTNFRQMVQEFTGIPDAPFAGPPSSSAFSRRSDLFAGGVSPEYSLRPPENLNSTTVTTSGFQIPPSETQGLTKQPLNLSNLQNRMFSYQSVSQTGLLQQVNASERENQRSEATSAILRSSTSLKRLRGQDENMMYFEGVDGDTQNGVVSSRSDGNQLAGDEDSWSF